ncbi:hypothetical protein NQ014_10810, partial [Corynebacterium sp. 5QC2CO]
MTEAIAFVISVEPSQCSAAIGRCADKGSRAWARLYRSDGAPAPGGRRLPALTTQRTGQCTLLGIACRQRDIADRRRTGTQLVLGPTQPACTEPGLRAQPELPLE